MCNVKKVCINSKKVGIFFTLIQNSLKAKECHENVVSISSFIKRYESIMSVGLNKLILFEVTQCAPKVGIQ